LNSTDAFDFTIAGTSKLTINEASDGNVVISDYSLALLDTTSGEAVTFAKTGTAAIINTTDNLTIQVAGTGQVEIDNGAFFPTTDSDIDLGKSTLEFKDLFIDGIADIDRLENNGAGIAIGDDLDMDAGAEIDFNLNQTTVGSAGGASALPGTPTGYVLIKVNGTERIIPFYDKA